MHDVRMAAVVLVPLVVVCGLGLAVPACGTGYIDYTYAEGDPDRTCLERPAGFAGPYWVTSSSALVPLGTPELVDCPLDLTNGKAYSRYTDLVAPGICALCSCLPSKGQCELPTKFTASTAVCGGGGLTTSFDAPASWNGACDEIAQVPPGTAKSLTIGPLTIKEESCPVGPLTASAVSSPEPYWRTRFGICYGKEWSQPGNSDKWCIPKGEHLPAPPSADPYRLCSLVVGDHECPTEPDDNWPDRIVVYEQGGIKDDRACLKECTCGPPAGSLCEAKASVYQNTCGSPTVEGDIGIASTGPKCFDIIPPEQPLGSKSATHPTYVSGACTAIPGEQTGDAMPTTPWTLCCKPEGFIP